MLKLLLASSLTLAMASTPLQADPVGQSAQTTIQADTTQNQPVEIHKALFIGDSMTGWLSERLGAYGKQNDFEVATVVWDGSTIKKWGASPRLKTLIREQKPDAIFISLGMNDLFESRPETNLKTSLDKILAAAGDVPVVWVGPPSWPGHNKGETLNSWLADKLGEGHYFRSFDLKLPRQSKNNPHPTRQGMIQWMDALVEWVQDSGVLKFPSIDAPKSEQMTRGKVFIYRRMKESL